MIDVNLKNLIQNVVESKNTEAKRRGIRILQTVDILHEDIVADAAKLMNIELNQKVPKRGMAAFFSHIVTGKKF